MSFDKVIDAKIAEYKVFDVHSGDELRKEASDVDFPAGFVYDPDFLYLWIRIVSAGEFYGSNKNADYFPESELIEWFSTFNDAHPFKNHENKNVEHAIGKIITVRWNPVMKCVELLKGIDKKRAPEIARGYIKGYLTDVSMGCKVPYTVCSVCGNKARRKSEFCDHVKLYRNQLLGNGERVYEINYKPRFHDSSTVLNGAERVAKAFFIVDAPPENALVSSFRKAASTGGTRHYVPATKEEMQKVAAYQDTLHPLLKEATDQDQPSYEQMKPYVEAAKQGLKAEGFKNPGQKPSLDRGELEQTFKDAGLPPRVKVASASPMMRKIAELEKELTGKLLNIVSQPGESEMPALNQMLEIVKFLTEKRMDDESLGNIATSVKEAAQENGVPVTRAFTTLIGVAELMGIEFFPHELHTLLRHLTDAQLSGDFTAGTSDDKPVYPGDYTSGMNRALTLYNSNAEFEDPSSLLRFYDEAAHHTDDFLDRPHSFFSSIQDGSDIHEQPPVRLIRIIRKTLEPIMPVRSYHREHLAPRISVILSGHKPVIGGPEVRRDLDMLTNPTTLGDMIGGLAYGAYEKMRPGLFGTRLIKVAAESMEGFSKTAEEVPDSRMARRMGSRAAYRETKPLPKNVSALKLALLGVPLAFGASAFQKSRRENGRYLSDGENFIADNPGILAGGAVLGAKPAAKGLTAAARSLSRGASAGGQSVQAGREKAVGLWGKLSEPFRKESFTSFEALVKEAAYLPSGEFNVFQHHDVLKKYASLTGASGEQASAVKMATLLSLAGMEKEAQDIMRHYDIPPQEKGRLLKIAERYMDEELEKAAEDFTNNMILSAIGDQSPLGRTLPGRSVDAFILKKLGEIGSEDKNKKLKTKPDIETPSSTQPWTENYRQGPALMTQPKGENS